MLGLVLYWWFIVGGLVVLALVWQQQRREQHSDAGRTAGRLYSTLGFVGGCCLAASGRLGEVIDHLPPTVAIGVAVADIALVGFMIFLPEGDVRARLRRRRR